MCRPVPGSHVRRFPPGDTGDNFDAFPSPALRHRDAGGVS